MSLYRDFLNVFKRRKAVIPPAGNSSEGIDVLMSPDMAQNNLSLEVGTRYLADKGGHLICYPYTLKGLHKMAKELDISARYFSTAGGGHYKIPASKRQQVMSKLHGVIQREVLLKIVKDSNGV